MKKVIAILLAAVMMLMSVPFSVSAAGYPSGTLGEKVKWQLNDDTRVLTITGEGEIAPEDPSWLFYPWTNYKSKIKTIVIGDGITKIGSKAFYDFDYLNTVTIGNGVTVIGEEAFRDCAYLNTVNLGSGVEKFKKYAFYDCNQLKDLYYAGDVSDWCSIDFTAWHSNPQYTAKNFYLNDTLVSGELVIPDGVTNIPKKAFYNCDGIESVTIADSVVSIGEQAFEDCNSLKSVKIGNGVEVIGEGAFHDCDALVNLTLGENLRTIERWAFAYCKKIESVTIPESVTLVGDTAFQCCEGIKEVKFLNSPAVLEESAFNWCKGMETLDLGNAIVSIGDDGFGTCTSLKEIIIPDSVISIGEGAFSSAHQATTLSIGKGLKTIGDDAFSGCTGLKTITVDPENTAYTSDECGVLFDIDKTVLMKYPTANERTSYVIPDSVITIEPRSFSRCAYLEYVTFGNSVETIGEYAFWDSRKLKEAVLPDSVTKLGEDAFAHCESIDKVSIGKGLTEIPRWTFNGCSIKELSLGENVTTIGEYAFDSGSGRLENLIIPDSVTQIAEGAFSGYFWLKSLTVGNGVSVLREYTFSSCYDLETVTLPNTITSVYDGAFYDCDNITDIYYEGTPEMWDKVFIGEDNGSLATATVHFGNIERDEPEIPANPEIPKPSQKCGEGVYWIFDEQTGELRIFGEGAMYDAYDGYYTNTFSPWFSFCEDIKTVVIDEGITHIGSFAFMSCDGIKEITIPTTVKTIGQDAFSCCTSLETVNISYGIEEIAPYAFYYCISLKEVNFDGEEWEWYSIYVYDGNECLRDAYVYFLREEYPDDEVIYYPCDVNGDSKISSSDALVVLQYSVGNIQFSQAELSAADINKDGKINSFDALIILQMSVGNI